MINGIKPEPSVSDFDSALNRLVENIHKDYDGRGFIPLIILKEPFYKMIYYTTYHKCYHYIKHKHKKFHLNIPNQ